MSPKQRFARKRVWVHRLIQGRILTNIVVYWGIYHLVLWHAMFLHRFMQYRDGLVIGDRAVPFAELYGQFVIDHVGFVICAFLVLPIVLWDSLWFSHRIVGPLHRIKMSIQQLARGEMIPRIRLRKKDFLVDLADAFNELRDKVVEDSTAVEKRDDGETSAGSGDELTTVVDDELPGVYEEEVPTARSASDEIFSDEGLLREIWEMQQAVDASREKSSLDKEMEVVSQSESRG